MSNQHLLILVGSLLMAVGLLFIVLRARELERQHAVDAARDAAAWEAKLDRLFGPKP